MCDGSIWEWQLAGTFVWVSMSAQMEKMKYAMVCFLCLPLYGWLGEDVALASWGLGSSSASLPFWLRYVLQCQQNVTLPLWGSSCMMIWCGSHIFVITPTQGSYQSVQDIFVGLHAPEWAMHLDAEWLPLPLPSSLWSYIFSQQKGLGKVLISPISWPLGSNQLLSSAAAWITSVGTG